MEEKKWPIKIIITILVAICSIVVVLPYLFMISSSFKPFSDIYTYPIKWIPSYWYPDNYIYVFAKNSLVLNMYFNSIKITTICVLGCTLTSSLAAYGYTKINFKGKNFLFLTLIATMMIPAQVTYVPRFALFTWLGLMNTHYALILPGLFAVFGTFLMRQFFMQLPDELVESAIIDGAGNIRIWWSICMPLAKPAIATFIITVFTQFWNDYETPLIYLRTKKLFTVPLGLTTFMDEDGMKTNFVMAYATISVLPIFIVFLAGQKYFIKGLITGAVKG